ncbi:unnamed protein product [Heligmosomoides polygyrus]|uniref:Uncharacterized protein n=1 Tax=Heligmosomoides polygyrus TaxID=6339 RepID=A0A183F7K0_HELPZ|nr:unnamed protein product [Heligmosomoides polygyrus]
MAATIDSLISLGLAQDAAFRKTNSYIVTVSRGMLPGDRRFSVENLNRVWIMEAKPPFKRRLTLRTSSPAGNAQLVLARPTTIPSSWIFADDIFSMLAILSAKSKVASGLTGKHGKDPDLTDLPENIVSFVTDFLMDALELGDPDIDMQSETWSPDGACKLPCLFDSHSSVPLLLLS